MVCYCCVKGCKSNSNSAKKDSRTISFHAFPSNPELRIKWLRAIGRPNWDPPNHARICSIHFNHDKINQDGYRTRIKEDACPMKALPPNSNFEASYLEVCRVCLATDTKMYSLDDEVLKIRFEAISGFNEKYNIEGLPLFICYMCKASLIKCYDLIEKSMIAQATLLDIFAENGQITKNLVRKQNRKGLNLTSSLSWHFETASQVFEYVFVEEESTSKFKNYFTDQEIIKNEQMKLNKEKLDLSSIVNINTKCKTEATFQQDNGNNYCNANLTFNNTNNIKCDLKKFESTYINNQDAESKELQQLKEVEKSDDEVNYSESHSINDSPQHSPARDFAVTSINHEESCNFDVKKNSNKKRIAGLTPDEISMEKYFNIKKLTLQEQIEEWKNTTVKPNLSNKTMYKCDVCEKSYASANTLNNHISCHDLSQGAFECAVCKKRFRSQVLMRSHANHMHGKKFHCKSCPKTFNNVSVAKKHERFHAGHRYSCSQCSFASAHSSALGAHARSQHARRHACARCGRAFVSDKGLRLHCATAHRNQQDNEIATSNAYRCHECDISFKSEGARRVHILTTRQHKENDDDSAVQKDPALRTTCKWCGVCFGTASEMTAHAREEHRRPAKKTSWRLPGDSYPTQCEHCSTTVNNRKEHWWHVRKQHPTEKGSYKPVITAVCDTCGKGFQNSTKLRIHSLRHSQPRLACERCPRVLHDKYALARHAAVHGPRPHACAACPRAFKHKANLTRHARVHTGATPYECNICGKKFKYSTSVSLHVRTVHYRLPHPPRKRRARDKPAENDML